MSPGREACLAAQGEGRALSHLAAWLLSLSHVPCKQTAARSNTNAAAVPSCRLACPASPGPWQAAPAEAFHTCPRSCDTLECPRAWGRVQDGGVQGQSWSFSRETACGSPCTVAVPGHRGMAPRGAPLPAARLQPWQHLLLQLLGFSLASPAAPGAKHNTSPSLWLSVAPAAFCVQPPKEGSSAASQERLGDPHPGSTPSSSAAGSPKTTLPRLMHVWGWHSCSLVCCCRWHSPIAVEAASWDTSWPRVRVSWLAIAKGFAGTSLASPGRCCNSGAGVRQSQGDAGSTPSTAAS